MKKEDLYARIRTQLQPLFSRCTDPVSRMATAAALLQHKMKHFHWTGFYLLQDGELVVGPYQGPVACMVLKKNTGVCWHAIQTESVTIVGDVHLFPGHIACDARSNSEIVIPLVNPTGIITGVMDVDSREFSAFDDTDAKGLQAIASMIYPNPDE